MALGKFKLKRNEVILTSAVALMLFFAYGRYWKKTQKTQEQALISSISQARITMDADRIMLDQLAASRAPASVQGVGAQELFEKYLKSNDRFSKIMAQLGESDDGFVVNRIAAESTTKAGAYTKTLLSMEIEAAFLSIGQFLEKLEDSPMLVEVESIEINRVATDLKLCNAKIKLFSYVAERTP
jgi:hypothetical protein